MEVRRGRTDIARTSGTWIRQLALTLLGAMVATLVACEKTPIALASSEGSDVQRLHAQIPYPRIDTFLGEQLHDDEEQVARKIALLMEQSIQDTPQKYGTAIRDAHPKAHGCVQAQFHVDRSLPPVLATGVLQPGHTYDAWIRFSNSSADPSQADITGDGRGMAVKLMGVPGEKILETEREATTQDFVMISHPVFIIDDPTDYLAFQTEMTSDSWFDKVLLPFTLGFKGSWNAHQITSKTIANPLQTRYWSMVPSQLGTGSERQAIKFSAKPFSDPGQSCPDIRDAFPSDPDRNFLRKALRNTLANGKACMEFLIQPRAAFMSVENSKDEWNESDAPFIRVATIEIPRQEFDTSEKNRNCENLSFNPWHALPEHRPLGVVNRLRKVIYPYISESRHTLNSAPRIEPQGVE